MSITKYGSGSVYKQTVQTQWYLDTLALKDLQSDPTDKAMVIPTLYDMKPYNLAHELYGNKDYWWVFQILNMGVIRDPIYDFKAGLTIRVPTKDRLLQTNGVEK